MRTIGLAIFFVLSLGGGVSLAQTSPPAPTAAPSMTLGLAGVPRIDNRRAPAPLPSGSSSKNSEPSRSVAGEADTSPNGKRRVMSQEAIADCLRLWDKGTHMTKGEWATTCRRVQGRVDNASIDVLAPKARRQ
jgi:hypothetical protein